MFNAVALTLLKNNLLKPYVLDEEGANIVYASNQGLAEEYFDHLEFPISNFWYRYFSSKINILPPKNYDNALDICAGTGTVSLNLMARDFFKKCEAIDISETAIAVLKKRIINLNISNLNAECTNIMNTVYPNNNFDCIFGNSFLHHLPDNESFLQEMFRILKKDGTICFTSEPTKTGAVLENFFLGNILQFLRFLKLKPKQQANQIVLSDIWLYDKKNLVSMLQEVGYTSIHIKGFGFLTALFNGPSSFLYQKITKKSMQPDAWWNFFTTLDKVLFFWLPNNMYSHFSICARKP